MTPQQAGVSAEAVAKLVEKWRKTAAIDREESAVLNARLQAGETVTINTITGPYLDRREICADELEAALATAPPEQAAVRTDSLEQPDHYDNVQPPISTTIGVIPCSTHTEIAKPIPGMTTYIPEQQPQAASAGALSAEQLRLLKLGHCPWDAERSSYDEEAEQVVHCHADADGYCNWAYCPQPLLAALAAHDQKVRAEVLTLAKQFRENEAENPWYGESIARAIEAALASGAEKKK